MPPPPAPAATSLLTPAPRLLGDGRSALIAAGVLGAIVVALFADLIFAGGDRVLSVSGTDTWGVFVGWCQFTVAEMARGNYLPLWNPHLYAGAPCLGGFQEALLYPSTWLLMALPIPQAINFGVEIHVFLAGFFTYLWMARRGVHPTAAMLSGAAFMLGGGYFMHIVPGHLPNLRTMAWAPLIFLAIDDLTTTRSLRGAWLGAGAVMMDILAGHPQYTYIIALIAGPYALLAIWRAPSRRTAIIGLALMGVGGIALSAAQLFTGLAAARESVRSGLAYEVASTYPFPPENLLTLILPSAFGQVSDHLYWGRWLLWEGCLFIGAAGVALAAYGVARGDRRLRPVTIFAFLAAALVISFGMYTPLYRLLYLRLPGIDSFRGISKVSFIAALFLANLVGVGMDRLLREEKIPILPAVISLATALVLVGIGAWIRYAGGAGSDGAWAALLYHIPWFAQTYPTSPIASATFFQASSRIVSSDAFWCGGVCLVLGVLWILSRRRRVFVYAIAVLAVLDLALFAFHNRFTFPMSEVTDAERQMEAGLQRLPGDARVITNQPSNVLGVGGFEGWGNDPMVMRRYARFMAIGQERTADQMPHISRPARTWGMARIFFMSPRGNAWMTGQPLMARGQLIDRVRVISDPEKMLKTLADPAFDARREVLLETPVANMPTGAGSADAATAGSVELNDLSTDDVEVRAEVSRPAFLLITDAYSQDWRVTPLEQPAPQAYEVVPGDHAFRAIALAPGHHHFLLRYQPPAFAVGAWVSLLSMVAWLGWGAWLSGWIKRRPSADGADAVRAPRSAKARKLR